MFLAFDIGNTNIKAGLFHEDDLIELKFFTRLSDIKSYIKSKEIDQAAVSSVVPALTGKISKILISSLKVSPFIIDKSSKFNIKINYDSFETLGIDRICSAEGAFAIFRSSDEFKNYSEMTYILSIDFGTATTINIIRYPGEFTGGVIAPGIGMMFESLKSKTAQLPEVSGEQYKNLVGTDTATSIASGVMNSSFGLIERILNYLKSDMNAGSIKIFITGGNAEKIIPHFPFKFQFEKGLVLLGIKAIYQKNIL